MPTLLPHAVFPLLCLLTLSTAAQVVWPTWTPIPMPGSSKSPVAAALPPDTSIVPPESALPNNRARWSGRWSGWACLDSLCDTKLAIEKLSSNTATFVYVFGSSSVRSNPQRVEGKFIGDELHGTLASGSRVAYRFRSDGALDFLFLPRSGNPVGGVLSRE